MPTQIDIFEDKRIPGTWRVEFLDRFGEPCSTIFVGLNAWARAASFREELIGDLWCSPRTAPASRFVDAAVGQEPKTFWLFRRAR